MLCNTYISCLVINAALVGPFLLGLFFSAPCQFTPFLNLLSLSFSAYVHWLAQSITQTPYLWWTYYLLFTYLWFSTTFLGGKQPGPKSRAGLFSSRLFHSSLKFSPSAEFPHRKLSAPLPNTCNTICFLSPILIWSPEWFLAEITNHTNPPYAIFCNIPLLPRC